MSDPLSIAAGVAGLLSFSASIVSRGYNFTKAALNAPKEVTRIVDQVAALNIILETVNKLQASTSRGNQTLAMLCRQGFLGKCDGHLREVEELLAKYEMTQNYREIGKRLQWPHRGKRVQAVIDELEGYCNILMSSLPVDTASNLTKLQNQVETFQSIQRKTLVHLSTATQAVLLKQDDILRANKGTANISTDILNGKILKWLSPIDAWGKQYANFKLHTPGTSTWVLEGTVLKEWLRHGSLLWLNGGAGLGKTIMTSAIIALLDKELQRGSKSGSSNGLAFHYCQFDDPPSLDTTDILGSLVRQLAVQCERFPTAITTLYQRSIGQLRAQMADLLARVCDECFTQVVIVIDGLDEIRNRKELLDILEDLITTSEQSSLRLLISSRPEHDIAQRLLGQPELKVMPEKHVKADVETYVKEKFQTEEKLLRLPDESKKTIVQTCSAQGMFRWAECHLADISRARTPELVDQALSHSPHGLDEMYDRMLTTIEREDQWFARRALMWLVIAGRQLSLAELAEASSIDPTRSDFHPRMRLLGGPHTLLQICGSLLDVGSPGSNDASKITVRLAHASVQEYLLSDRCLSTSSSLPGFSFDVREANFVGAAAILTYLKSIEAELASRDYKLSKELSLEFPLYEYAEHFWKKHSLRHGLEAAMEWSKSVFAESGDHESWLALATEDQNSPPTLPKKVWNCLKEAAEVSFYCFVEGAIDQPNQSEPCRRSLKTVFDRQRHWEQRLKTLGDDSELDENDFKRYPSPLHAAASLGFNNTIRALISRGSDINSADRFVLLDTPLQFAVSGNHLESVRLLIMSGANPNGTASFSLPLHRAASLRHPKMVKHLLDLGADPNCSDGFGMTLYHWMQRDQKTRDCLKPFGTQLFRSRAANASIPDSLKRQGSMQIILKLAYRITVKSEGDRERIHRIPQRVLTRLIQCALLSDMPEAAMILMEHGIQRRDSQTIVHSRVFCDGCSSYLAADIEGPRYRCKTCFFTDLCQDCYNAWQLSPAGYLCEGHNFLKVPRDEWYTLAEDIVDAKGRRFRDFIRDFIRDFSKSLGIEVDSDVKRFLKRVLSNEKKERSPPKLSSTEVGNLPCRSRGNSRYHFRILFGFSFLILFSIFLCKWLYCSTFIRSS